MYIVVACVSMLRSNRRYFLLDNVPVMFHVSAVDPHLGSGVRRCTWAGVGGRSALGGYRGFQSRTPVVAPAEYYGSVPYRWAKVFSRAFSGVSEENTG